MIGLFLALIVIFTIAIPLSLISLRILVILVPAGILIWAIASSVSLSIGQCIGALILLGIAISSASGRPLNET